MLMVVFPNHDTLRELSKEVQEPSGSSGILEGATFRAEDTTMRKLTQDLQSLTGFRRNTATFAKLLKKSKRPLTLTHKGKPELVVRSVAGYQRLLDLAALQDENEGIRQGMEDAKNGRARPAEEFFAELEARHGIRRLV
jgi:PHD/YefM family antitoxin component YafN of YafNO toxin-antitoxin module